MTGRRPPLDAGAGFDLDTPRRMHVVGIGGAGMSAVATLLVSLGHTVSGSDFKESRFTQRLRQIGVRVHIGHRAEHVTGAEAVAISSAVRSTNPEVEAAREAGIPVLRRAEILRLLTTRWQTIAVAGTHGKTTTSSMLAMVLAGAGLDPSYIVGGELNEPGANAHRGGGEYLVCEADESDGTFLVLGAAAAVVTSVDADHLEFYGDVAGIEDAFGRFLAGVSGPRVVCLDDPGAARVGRGLDVVGYGTGADARYRAAAVELGRHGAAYRLVVDDADAGRVEVATPGAHNVLNSLGALSMALELGADTAGAIGGLRMFRGVGRRFEFRRHVAGIDLVDDYAHLPAEVAAALAAARAGGWSRVIAVFQPHLYSRTAAFAAEFGAALAAADVAVVTDVYGAREDPVPGVTGELVADAVRASGGRVEYVGHRSELAEAVAAQVARGDVCLSLGAGDISSLADEVAAALERSRDLDPLGRAAGELAGLLSVPPQRDMPLAPLTSYRIGGPAALFVEPEDEEELLAVKRVLRAHRLPHLIVGRGSNMLVSDAGFAGVAIRLGGGFNWIRVEGERVRAGGATPLPYLARASGRAGLTGLEWGVGIPASVGGAVRMNAGGHGAETADVLARVGIVDLDGDRDGEREAAALCLSYRESNLDDSDVVTWAEYRLAAGDRDKIEADMSDVVRWRKENQPGGLGNAGSVFRNPPGDSAGRLVDTAGCKGLRIGGAQVSEVHANFVVAEPWALAADVRALMEAVRRRVQEVHGVALVAEVRLVGEFPG